MAGSESGRGQRRSRERNLKRVGRDGRGKARRIGLQSRVLLALGQVRAGWDTGPLVEEVVDEVGGKGDQVGRKQPRRQDAQEPTEQATHWGSMVPDFLVYATIQSV